MSGALAPLVIKVVTGGVVSKLVGEVTGNEKLGMIAGLVSGSVVGNPAAAATDVASASANGGMGAGVAEAGLAPTVESAVAAPSVGGMFSEAGNFIKENPAMSMIGAQTVMGGAQGYMASKEAEKLRDMEMKEGELDRKHDVRMQNLRDEEAQRAYNRTHQPLPSGYSVGGISAPSVAAPVAERPMTAPEEYFERYTNMYGRVR